MDSTLGTQIIVGILGVVAGLGVLLTVFACWSLGRANYRG
mgnify:CR=1|jgi:hypothetical protein